MKDMLLNWKCQMLAWFRLHAIQESIGNVVQIGVCGALGGMVFGSLHAQGSGDLPRIILDTGVGLFFGFMTGAAAGTLFEVWRTRKLCGKSSKTTVGELAQTPKTGDACMTQTESITSQSCRRSKSTNTEQFYDKFSTRSMSHSWRQFRDEIVNNHEQFFTFTHRSLAESRRSAS